MSQPIRYELVNEIKRSIEAGTYFSERKFAAACQRLRLDLAMRNNDDDERKGNTSRL